MANYRKMKAAYDFQQRTRRAHAEMRWHAVALPGAVTRWVLGSFEFLMMAAAVAILIVIQNGSGLIGLKPVTFSHPATSMFADLPQPTSVTAETASSTLGAKATAVPERYVPVAQMTADARNAALFGSARPQHFDRYFAYLETVRDQMNPTTFAFFADYARYSFSDVKSVFGLSVRDVEETTGRLNLRLTDPVFDREMTLSYDAVTSADLDRWRDRPGLLSHEAVVNADGQLIHSLVFTDNSVMQIVASSLAIYEALAD